MTIRHALLVRARFMVFLVLVYISLGYVLDRTISFANGVFYVSLCLFLYEGWLTLTNK